MFRNDNRCPQRRHVTFGPQVILTFRGQTEIHFHPATEEALKVFFGNLARFDEGAFKEAVAQTTTRVSVGGNECAVLSVDDLAKAVKTGEKLFTGYPPDGPERDCGFCSKKFQPRILGNFQKADGVTFTGGNLGTFKRDVLLGVIEALKTSNPTLAERLVAAAETTTAEVTGEDAKPALTLIMPVCPDCRPNFYANFVALESAKAALTYAEEKIGAATERRAEEAEEQGNRNAVLRAMSTVTGRTFQPRPRPTAGRPASDRPNGHFNSNSHFNRDRREDRPERVNWHGALLEPRTVTALEAAGYTTPSTALEALQNLPIGELEKKGICHAGSIAPISMALKRAMEGRQVVGEAKGDSVVPAAAKSVVAPGTSRPATKRHEFTAPPRGATRSRPRASRRGKQTGISAAELVS